MQPVDLTPEPASIEPLDDQNRLPKALQGSRNTPPSTKILPGQYGKYAGPPIKTKYCLGNILLEDLEVIAEKTVENGNRGILSSIDKDRVTGL
jgi:hypothetical protein